jgi:hypothetical protein
MMNLSDHTVLDATPLEQTLAPLTEHLHLGYWTLHHLQRLSIEGALQLQSAIKTKPEELINDHQDIFYR